MKYIDFYKGTIKGRYDLHKSRTRIGRQRDGIDIVVDDPENKVSRLHMDIIVDKNGKVYVQDLNSFNGTYVNSKMIGRYGMDNKPYALKDGDVVSFGSLENPETFKVGMKKTIQQKPQRIYEHQDNKRSVSKCKQVKFTYNIKSKLNKIKDLSEGKFGKATLVQDEDGNKVVIKTNKIKTPIMEKRFERECKNHLNMHHPNILKAYAYRTLNINQRESEKGLVMEYAAEGTLQDYITNKGGKLPIIESLEIALQLLEVLKYFTTVEITTDIRGKGLITSVGIVHRDLSPNNIFSFNNHSLFKVGDFGLSKSLVDRGLIDKTIGTRSGEVFGKPKYMSRIQFVRYWEGNFFCDLWSVMAILFYMITGGHPRYGKADMSKPALKIEEEGYRVLSKYKKQYGVEPIDRLIHIVDTVLAEETLISSHGKTVKHTTAAGVEKELVSILNEIKKG